MNAIVRESMFQDAEHLSKNLRKADLRELYATFGSDIDVKEVLKQSIDITTNPKTIEVDGKPIGVFGVVDGKEDIPTLGWVWMVGTDRIGDIKHYFLRNCRHELEKMQDSFEVLCNYVDARNTVHIKWLRWMGFSFLREVPEYGEEKRTFYEFARVNINV